MPPTSGRRTYPSDLADAQWALLDPWLSVRAWTGRPRPVDLREVVNAVFYLLRTGCQWRQLPHDFPHSWLASMLVIKHALRACPGCGIVPRP
jgi:putative transposase